MTNAIFEEKQLSMNAPFLYITTPSATRKLLFRSRLRPPPLGLPIKSQFKHVMQPFDVSISPEGIEVHRESSPSSGPTSTLASTPTLTSTSTSTAFVTTVSLSIANRYDHTDRLREHLVFGWKVEVDGFVVAAGDDLLPAALGSSPSAAAVASPAVHRISEATATVGMHAASGGGGGNSGGKVSVAKVMFETPSLLLPGQECWLTVTGRLRGATAWAAAGHVVGHTQLELRSEKVREGGLVPADILGSSTFPAVTSSSGNRRRSCIVDCYLGFGKNVHVLER